MTPDVAPDPDTPTLDERIARVERLAADLAKHDEGRDLLIAARDAAILQAVKAGASARRIAGPARMSHQNVRIIALRDDPQAD